MKKQNNIFANDYSVFYNQYCVNLPDCFYVRFLHEQGRNIGLDKDRSSAIYIKKKGIEFNIEELEDINNYESPQYFERAQAYELKFWEIAYHTKLINPFICKTCMSFYIGLFYAIGFIYFLNLGFAFSVAFVFVQNLIVFFLIELKSN